jgi:alpha-tubulin suppressor-like RCC1 family protein
MNKTVLSILSFVVSSVLMAQTPRINSGEGGNKSAQIKFGFDAKVIFAASCPDGSNTFVIKSDSSLWAFGLNDYYQLGDNSTNTRTKPVRIGNDNDWVFVVAGRYNTAAIKADGTLWMWGYNAWGQLGDGTSTTRTTPKQIGSDKNWVTIALTMHSTLALKSDGTIWSWGHNGNGRLGRGFTGGDYSDIKQIGTSKNWSQISAGSHFSMARQKNGSIYLWGNNGSGQLGDSSTTDLYSPTKIDTGYIFITCGSETAMGIKRDSTIWAWGRNDQTLYGNGTSSAIKYPTQTITSKKWKSISVGGIHAIGLQYDGSLWGWGNGTHGAIGDSTWNHRSSPVRITSIKNPRSIAAGSNHTAVVSDSGKLLCFGYNGYYQLGLGNTNNYFYPTITINSFRVKNFAIYRSKNPISDTATVGLVSNKIPNSYRQFTDTGLTNLTRYYYRVKAIDSSGIVSSFSNAVRVSINQPPSSVDFSSIESGARRVHMTWTSSKSKNVKYRIYRGLSTSTLKPVNDTTSMNWYLDSGLLIGLNYYYGIRVVDTMGVQSDFGKIVKIGIAGKCYVSTKGSNNDFGTLTSPYESIPCALRHSQTGDTIIVEDGVYEDQVYFGSKGIVLSSRFILDGDTNHIKKTRLDGVNHFGSTYFINGPSSQWVNFQIVGLTIENVVGYAVALNNYVNSKIQNVYFENLGNSGGSAWACIYVYGNTLFEQCVFRYNPAGSYVIQMQSTYGFAIMDRCVWYENGGSTSRTSRGLIWTSRMILRNSYFYHNYCGVINGGCNQGMDSCMIINNAFVENYSHAFRLENCSGGLTYFFINNIFENNKYTFGWEGSGYSVVNLRNNLIKDLYRKSNGYPNKSYYRVNLSNNDTLNESGIKYPVKSIEDIKLPAYSRFIGYGIASSMSKTDYNKNVRPNPSGTAPDLGPIETSAYFASPQLTATDGGNKKVTIFWTQSSFTGLNKYKLYRSTKSISDTATIGLVTDTLGSKTLSYKDSGLTNLTKYYYRIKSVNSSGVESGYSNELSAKPNTPPSAVDSILVQNGPRLNYITWTASKSSPVKYRVYRGLTKSSLQVIRDTTSKLNFLDTGLTAWKTYYYAIRAIDTVGVPSAYSTIKVGVPNNIWWVDTAGNNNKLGSISFPFATIEYAINKAQSSSHDTIYIKRGLHKANINPIGKNIVIEGYMGSQYTIVEPKNTNDYLIYLSYGEPRTMIIKGLTFQNALLTLRSTPDRQYCNANIQNCVFTKCGSPNSGSPVISTHYGGLRFDNCIFYKNLGLTMYFDYKDTSGGMGNFFVNCSFIDNYRYAGGGQNGPGRIYFSNCIFWETQKDTLPELSSQANAYIFQNCIIKDNYFSKTTSNTNVDPEFLDATNGDFSLKNSSKAIGAGQSKFTQYGYRKIDALNTDFVNKKRPSPFGSNPDLGAFENFAAFPSPTLMTTEGGNNKITLTWTQSSFTGLNKYKLYRSTKPISDTATIGLVTDTLGAKTLSYRDSGLTNLTRYYYRIKSVNSSGVESGFSNELSARPNTPPSVVDSVLVQSGPRLNYITWTASKSSPVKYRVYRGLTKSSLQVIRDTTSKLNFLDTGLLSWKAYYYSIRAIDTTGVASINSSIKSGVPNNIFWVDKNGDNNNNGSSAFPLKSINSAINRANSVIGDTVYVNKGRYFENVNFSGKSILVSSNYKRLNDTSLINTTIIDGGNKGNTVTINSGETLKSRLEGFSVTNGYSGLYISSGKLSISDLRFYENRSYYAIGSAIIVTGANQLIANNTVVENHSGTGGVIYITSWNSYGKFNNLIVRNNSGNSNGIIICDLGSMDLYNVLMYSNGDIPAIGVMNAKYGLNIVNSTIISGKAAPIRVLYNNIQTSNINVLNSILTSTYSGKQIEINNHNPSTNIWVRNSIVKGGYNNIEQLISTSIDTGDLNTIFDFEPGFRSAVNNDFSLSNSSKVLGLGNNLRQIANGDTIYVPKIDILGKTRPIPNGTNSDIGAYENAASFSAPKLLSIEGGNQKAELSWSQNTVSGLSKFKIYRSTKSISDTSTFGLLVDTLWSGRRGYKDSGLTNLTRYYYRIKGVTSAGLESGFSNELSIRPNTPPQAPDSFISESGVRMVNLRWTASKSGSVKRYALYRGSAATVGNLISDTLTRLSYLDTGLIVGREYKYFVRSLDSVGVISAGNISTKATPTRIWYVSSNKGDDKNIGIESRPLKTISAAILKTQQRDTIVLLPGRYSERLNMRNRWIHIGSKYLLTGDTSFINNTIINGFGTTSSTNALIYDDGQGYGYYQRSITGITIDSCKGYAVALTRTTLDRVKIRNNQIVETVIIWGNGRITNSLISDNGKRSSNGSTVIQLTDSSFVKGNIFRNLFYQDRLLLITPQSNTKIGWIEGNQFLNNKPNHSESRVIWNEGNGNYLFANNLVVETPGRPGMMYYWYSGNSDSIYVLNNTFIGNGFGLYLGTDHDAFCQVQNNIISIGNGSRTDYWKYLALVGSGRGVLTLQMENNVFDSSLNIKISMKGLINNISGYYNIDTAYSGNNWIKNAGIEDKKSGKYGLSGQSSFLGAGVLLPAKFKIDKDLFGNNRNQPAGTKPDYGAIESRGSFVSPLLLTIDGGNQKAELQWSQANVSGLNKFKIYRSNKSIGDTATLGLVVDTLWNGRRIYKDSGLTNLTRYYYRIKGVTSAGLESGFSNELSIRPNTPPSTPDTIKILTGPRSAKLLWKKSKSSSVTYTVYRGTHKDSLQILKSSLTELALLDKGLVSGRKYYYAVRSKDSIGVMSSYSKIVEVIPNRLFFVDTLGRDTFNLGSSFEPLKTISHAISRILDGDTIIVNRGLYLDPINYSGKQVNLWSKFALTRDTNDINQTIIDGSNYYSSTPLIYLTDGNNQWKKVSFGGFTIKNATATALYIQNYAHSEILNCKFLKNGNNTVWGTLSISGNTKLRFCNVSDNSGRYIIAMGASSGYGFPEISNCEFTRNGPAADDKSVIFTETRLKIFNNIFYNNYIPCISTGANGNRDSVLVQHNTIADNKSSALFFYNWGGGSNVYIENNIIENNKWNLAFNNSGFSNVFLNSNYIKPFLRGTNVYPNPLYFNLVVKNHDSISYDQFAYPIKKKGDLRLKSASLILGLSNLDSKIGTDFYGNIRPQPKGTNSDMGAIESPYGFPGPNNIYAEPGNQKVTVIWSKSTYKGVNNYVVYRSKKSIADTSTISSVTDTIVASSISFKDSGLVNLTRYYYRLKTKDSKGVLSGYSEEISAIPNTPPSAVDTINISKGPRFIAMDWSSSKSKGVYYRVYRGETKSSLRPFVDSLKVNSWKDTSVIPWKRYYYTVKAVDTVGVPASKSIIVSEVANRIWYIDTAGKDQNSGAVFAPLKTIKRGVYRAREGDTVLLLPGIYRETFNTEKSILIASRYILTWDTTDISKTIVDGSTQTSPTSIMVKGKNLNMKGFTYTGMKYKLFDLYNSRISQMRIVNNPGPQSYTVYGGDFMYFSGRVWLDSSLILNNGNQTYNAYQHIFYCNGQAFVSNNKFKSNYHSNRLIALYTWNAGDTQMFVRNIVDGNYSGGYTLDMQGGYGARIGVENNVFSNNINSSALYINRWSRDSCRTPITIVNNIFYKSIYGINIHINSETRYTAIIQNNIFNSNSKDNIYFLPFYSTPSFSPKIKFLNNLIGTTSSSAGLKNIFGITYADTIGSGGNMGFNPGFADTLNGNIFLGNSSMALGKGKNDLYTPKTDLLGNSRPFPSGSNCDLGAFEFRGAFPGPELVSIVPGNSKANLKWRQNSISGIDNYKLFRSTSPITDSATIGVIVDTLSPLTLAYKDSGLINLKRYFYRIKAVTLTGLESGFSNQISTIPNSPPKEPDSLTIENGVRTLYLKWSKSTSGSTKRYAIYRGSSFNSSTLLSDTITSLQFVDVNLKSNIRYTYYLKSVDSVGVVSSGSKICSGIPNSIWFVSLTGNDKNYGTDNKPLKTISKAIGNSMYGDTIILNPGRYEERINLTNRVVHLGSRYLISGDTAFIEKTRLNGFFTTNYLIYDDNNYVKNYTRSLTGICIDSCRNYSIVAGRLNLNQVRIRKNRSFAILHLNNSIVNNSIFSDNTTSAGGSQPIYLYDTVIVENSIFMGLKFQDRLMLIQSGSGNFVRLNANKFIRNNPSSTWSRYIWNESSSRTIISNNLIVDSSDYQGYLYYWNNSNSDSIFIVNNTLVGGRYALLLNSNGSGIITLQNNIISPGIRETRGYERFVKFEGWGAGIVKLIARNNVFDTVRSNSNYYWKNHPDIGLIDTTGSKNNFALSPQFNSSRLNDYSLNNASLLLSKGTFINGKLLIFKDINGQNRAIPAKSNPDIGAFESPYSFPAPILTTLEGGKNKVFVQWEQSVFPGLSYYKLYRSTAPISDTATIGIVVDTLKYTTLSFKDSGLTNLTRYYYRVRCVNSFGELSGFSNQMSTVPNTPPLPPDSLVAFNGPRMVLLRWKKSSITAVNYRVYRSVGNTANFKLIADKLTKTELSDQNLTVGNTYFYKVLSVDSVGVVSDGNRIVSGRPNRIYWVSNNGDSSFIGSAIYPLKGVNHAIYKASSGDTIAFEKGVYREDIALSKSLTFISRAILSSKWDTSVVNNTVIEGFGRGVVFKANTISNITFIIDGITFAKSNFGIIEAYNLGRSIVRRSRFMNNGNSSSNIISANGNLLIDSCYFEGNLGTNIITAGNTSVSYGFPTVSRCVFFANGNSNNNSSIVNFWNRGFLLGSIIANNRGNAVTGGCNGPLDTFLVEQNTIVSNKGLGIYIDHCYGGILGYFTNNIIENNSSGTIAFISNASGFSIINLQSNKFDPSPVYSNNPSQYKVSWSGNDTSSRNVFTYPIKNIKDLELTNKSFVLGTGYDRFMSGNSRRDLFGMSRPTPTVSLPDIGALESPFAFVAPELISADGGNQKASITWTQISYSGLSKFKIYRSTKPISDTATIGLVSDTINSLSRIYKDSGLTNKTRYYYRIKSINKIGIESGFSNQISVFPNTPPKLPDSINVIGGPRLSVISWNNSKTGGVKYYLYRKLKNGVDVEISNGTKSNLWIDTALLPWNSYGYSLQVVDSFDVRSIKSVVKNVVPNQIWYVDTAGNDLYNYGGNGSRLKSIQIAADKAKSGDTILLMPGKYQQRLVVDTKLTLTSNYCFSKKKTDVDNTIIDGSSISNPSYVLFNTGDFEIIGVTIKGMKFQLIRSNKLILKRVVIQKNPGPQTTTISGADFIMAKAGLIIDSSEISENGNSNFSPYQNLITANGNIDIRNAKISKNHFSSRLMDLQISEASHTQKISSNLFESNYGSGTILDVRGTKGKQILIQNNVISRNIKSKAIVINRSTSDSTEIPIAIANNLFFKNDYGIQLRIDNNSRYSSLVENNIFNNQISDNIYIIPSNATPNYIPKVTFLNNLIGNVPNSSVLSRFYGIDYCDTNGSMNNISGNPDFADTGVGNFILMNSSLALGFGVKNFAVPNTDLTGNWRPQPYGSNSDLGPFESKYSIPAVVLDSIRTFGDSVLVIFSITRPSLSKYVLLRFSDSSGKIIKMDSIKLISNRVNYLVKSGKFNGNKNYSCDVIRDVIDAGPSNKKYFNILGTPVLQKPVNSSVNQALKPILRYGKTRYAQQYLVQLSTIRSFASVIHNTKVSVDTFAVTTLLKNNSTYYWRVRSEDSMGYSKWSDTFQLQTLVQVPKLVSATTLDREVSLSWSISDTTNMFKFYIYRDTLASSSKLIDSVSSTSRSYVDKKVIGSTRYFYQLRLENKQYVLGDYSQTRSVSVMGTPELQKPVNSSVNQALKPILRYGKTRYAQQYLVQLSTVRTFASVIHNTKVSVDTFAVTTLLKNNSTYYWRVRSEDSMGYSKWSDTFQLQTLVQVPIVLNRSTIDTQVVLNWKISDTTNMFKFYIYRDTTATAKTLIDSVSSSSRTYVDNYVQVSTKYYYRIRLENKQYVLGDYSNEGSVSILQRPILLSPSNFTVNQSLTPVLRYAKSRYAQLYRIQLSANSSFVNTVSNSRISSDSLAMVTLLKYSSTYYWRVRAEDSLGYSKWSDTFKFQTKVQVPILTTRSTAERQATVNWKMTDTTNMFKFYIYRDTTATATTLIDSVSSSSRTYVDNGVQVSTKYYYRIRLENKQYVMGDYSNEGSVSVLDKPILLIPSDTLKKVDLASTLKWTSQRYAMNYRIQVAYNDSLRNPWKDIEVKILDTFDIVNPRYNYNYYWRVRSQDSTGYSQWSSFNLYQTLLATPKIDSSRAGNKKIRLYWKQSDTQNIKHYHIYRNLSNQFPTGFSPIATVTGVGSKVNYNYLDSGLSNFTYYYYWIKAVNNQSVKSAESIVDSNWTFNISPVAQVIKDTAFNNVGRNSRVKHYFLQTGAYDVDGYIDSTVWYIDDIRVSNDDSLKYKFRQGTTKVAAVVFDNDEASDTVEFLVHQLTYKKPFREGLINGVTAYNENEIYVADTSLNSFGLGEILCLDTNGNKKINYLVNERIRTTPSMDYKGNMFLTNGISLNSFANTGSPLFSGISLGGLSFVTPTIDSVLDRIYLGVSNKKFFALDINKDGKTKWDFTADAPISSPAVITAGRKLIFTDISGKMYGFDISTSLSVKTGGSPTWKYNGIDSILLAPALDTMEKVIVGTNMGNAMKLTFDSFGIIKTNWVTPLMSKITTSPILDAYGHIYFGCQDGKLYCLKSSNGKIIWSFNTGAPIVSTPTLSDESRIYVANVKGHIYALDTAKNIMWYYLGKEKIIGHLVHVNGATYVPSEAGSLFVIYDKGIINDIKTIKSQVTARGKKLMVPKPIWGTFQGNSRRTGSQDGIFKVVPEKVADDNSVILYPNPCLKEFTMESLFGVTRIDFVDVSGKLMQSNLMPNATKYKMDVADLPPGLYFLKIYTERGMVIKKMGINL